MANVPASDMPRHPEEMKADYTFRLGNMMSVQASARITPAGSWQWASRRCWWRWRWRR